MSTYQAVIWHHKVHLVLWVPRLLLQLPLPFTSTTCPYYLPLPPASTTCVYHFGLPFASVTCVYHLRLLLACSTTPKMCSNAHSCRFGVIVPQELYANSQQMAPGIQALLEMALTEGRAVAGSLADSQNGEAVGEGEEDTSVGKLSNAAMLASSILATHGVAEVSFLLIFPPLVNYFDPQCFGRCLYYLGLSTLCVSSSSCSLLQSCVVRLMARLQVHLQWH